MLLGLYQKKKIKLLFSFYSRNVVCNDVFDVDKSHEAEPVTWYQKDKCAWPKKNYKKYLDHRTEPKTLD